MRYGSVCSGIEAASAAWHGMGWQPAWFAEVEPFPSAVLAHHYPEVTNLGDMTKIASSVLSGAVEAPDVLVGGTPCQAFSIAGLRNSLDDDRGQLSISFIHLADAIDAVRSVSGRAACTVVWENVPGVLSTKDNAFGCFLAGLAGEDSELLPSGKKWTNAGCVYGPKRTVVWRVLDAQYFGLAQRRKRVFVVASARAGFDPAAVLFEREGVRRDFAPSREKGEAIAPTVAQGAPFSRTGNERVEADAIVATFDFQSSGEYGTAPVASTMSARDYKSAKDLVAFHPTQDPISSTDGSTHCMGTGSSKGGATIAVAFCETSPTLAQGAGGGAGHLYRQKGNETALAANGMQVRRLTPRECERLQGFPDDYTLVQVRNKPAADGPRYKALGNSMAVPVMRWIGHRINDAISRSGGAK